MEDLEERLRRARLAEAAKAEEPPGAVRSFFTGEGRTEGYPELGTSGPSVPFHVPAEPLPERYQPPGRPHTELKTVNPVGMKLAAGYATTPDPQATADIALKALKEVDPSVSMGKDKYGNPTITFEGQTYYINAPGVSTGDFFNLLGQIGAYAPAARLSTARNLFTRMVQTGTLATGTSAGLDVAAGELGSEQGVSGSRALLTGATGALFEGLAPVAKHAWRTIFGRQGMFDEATGQLTESGKDLAIKAGLDPEMMQRRLAKAFAREAIDEPVPALAKTRAYTEAYGVPFTRGQQMAQAGALSQSAREEAMRHGTAGFGDIGAGGMRRADKSQALHTRGAAEGTTEALAGGRQAITSEAEAGGIVQEGLRRVERDLNKLIDEAYAQARDRHAVLKGTPQEAKNLIATIDDALTSFDLDPQLFPSTMKNKALLSALRKKKKDLTIRELEVLRRKMRNNINAAPNRSDAEAAGRVLRAFDDWEDDAMARALFEGDEDALLKMKVARAARVKKRLTLEASDKFDDAGKVIQDILARDPSAEQVANAIMGLGKLGKKNTSQKVVERLRDIFGEGSLEWNSVREASWMRLMNDTRGVLKKPKQFVADFDEFFNRHPTLAKTLFTEDEVKMMRAVRDIMDMRIVPEGATNPSKTGYTMMRGVRDLVRRGGTAATFSGHHLFGGGLFLLGRSLPFIGPGAQQRAVKTATTQIPKPAPSAPPFVAAGTGAANVADPEGELRKDLMP